MEQEQRTEWHTMRDSLSRRYGDKVGHFLAARVGRDVRRGRCECMSDFRTCQVGDVKQEQLYEEIRAGGCCGFYDQSFRFEHRVLGVPVRVTTYKVGFNYGH